MIGRLLQGRLMMGVVAGAALVATVACDPCAGIVGCSGGDARLSVEGRLLDPWDAHPGAGARVSIIRREGVELDQDSVTVIAGSNGHFRLEMGARETGTAIVDVVVEPVDGPPYRVFNVELEVDASQGAGNVLSPWGTRLQLPYWAELFHRFNRNQLATNTAIEFRRTGGAELYGSGIQDGVYRSQTDAFGRVQLFGDAAYAMTTEDVIGDLTVMLPPPYGPSTTTNVRLSPSQEFRPTPRVPRIGAGPNLPYSGVFHLRADLKPIVGMRVDFRRTGGIAISPETFTMTTNADGYIDFKTIPLAEGVLRGELIVHPPPPATQFTIPVELPTLHQDQSKLIARWGIGPHLLWYGRLVANGAPISNVEVEIRRVSGIPIEPEVWTFRTRQNGEFPFEPKPLAYGEVVVDMTVRSPAPYTPFTIRGLRFQTSEEDVFSRPFGVWDVATGQKVNPDR